MEAMSCLSLPVTLSSKVSSARFVIFDPSILPSQQTCANTSVSPPNFHRQVWSSQQCFFFFFVARLNPELRSTTTFTRVGFQQELGSPFD
ncbi:hypothetical protein L218DRAFT_54563 [Marasmius fiardii PR-910]|nr:hypothetical protein L218DRAFT_54563 [Marasmius fiardii PR-910]